MVFEFHGAGRINWICCFLLNSRMELRKGNQPEADKQPVGAVVHCDTYSGRFSSLGSLGALRFMFDGCSTPLQASDPGSPAQHPGALRARDSLRHK